MKLILLLLVFILISCKSNTINQSLKKVAVREDITPSFKVPKKRTKSVVFFEYQLIKEDYDSLKIEIDSFQCELEKESIIDSLLYPKRKNISISSNTEKKDDINSSNYLKAMIRELKENLLNSNDLLNIFIDNQNNINSIEMDYNSEISEYYKNLSKAIEIEFYNQAIDQCNANKYIIELKLNDLRSRFELKRASY